MDYFKELISRIYSEYETIDDVIIQFCQDVEAYREFSIKRYNSNIDRGTDVFCFNDFLNTYSLAINVYGLHSEMNHKKQFNRLIDDGWLIIKERKYIIKKTYKFKTNEDKLTRWYS